MLPSIIAAGGMCADGVAEGMYAARHGFAARIAGLGYAIGAVLGWLYGAVTPITYTVESITVATRSAKERPQILYIVALSAVPSAILGLLGLYSSFIDLLSPAVIAGVIAGVGIILTGVGVDYIRARPIAAGGSTAAGFVSYLLTDNLVVVIISAMVIGTVLGRFLPEQLRFGSDPSEQDSADGSSEQDEYESNLTKFRPMPFRWRDLVSRTVLVGAFSVFALRTGAVVSYANVNAGIAGTEPNLDGATAMAGLGSLVSAVFGGPPVETTPAPMAAAPMPVFSTVLFMAFMTAITLLGLVARLGRFVPLQAIAGFLIVLGIPVILPDNLPMAMEDPLPGATALAVTALSNPFYGILAGEAIVLLQQLGLAA